MAFRQSSSIVGVTANARAKLLRILSILRQNQCALQKSLGFYEEIEKPPNRRAAFFVKIGFHPSIRICVLEVVRPRPVLEETKQQTGT